MSQTTEAFMRRLDAQHVRRVGRTPAQTGAMTWNKLQKLIRAGYGQGHLANYQPWLRVTKRDCSPVSNMSHLHAADLGHTHHPRSVAQRHLLHRLAWVGALDARDQFPLWPWDSDHPLDGLFGARYSRSVRGMAKIADEMGIPLSRYVGSNIPRILTLHALATLCDAKFRVRLIGFQVDSNEGDERDEVCRRDELLLLRRRYCVAAGMEFKSIKTLDLVGNLSVNLDAIRPSLDRPTLESLRASQFYKDFLAKMEDDAYTTSPAAVIDKLLRCTAPPRRMLQTALHVALWSQDLDHDLSLPFEMWNPLARGGIELRKRVRADLFGRTE